MSRITSEKAYPRLVVGMLWFVALLNYLDRQMLATMKPFMEDGLAGIFDKYGTLVIKKNDLPINFMSEVIRKLHTKKH